MSAPRPTCALALALTALASTAGAQSPPRYALELSLSPAVDLAFTRGEQPPSESNPRVVGGALWLAATLRSPHFLEPFVEGGVFHLRASEVGALDAPTLRYRASVTARSLLFGLSASPWRWLRVRAAMGLCDVDVTASGGGRTIHPNNLDLAWSFDLVAWIWRWPRVRFGATARALLLPESAYAVAAIGLAVSFDAAVW